MAVTTDKSRYRIEIVLDDDPPDPRDWDNLGTMACWHKRYNLGDKHDFSEPIDFMRELADSASTDELIQYICGGMANGLRFDEHPDVENPGNRSASLMSYWDFNKEWYEEYSATLPLDPKDDYLRDKILENMSIGDLRRFAERANLIIPIYLLDHSSLSMSTRSFNDPWDSGQVGFIYASHKKIAEEYGGISPENMEKAEKLVRGEVQNYDNYLRGECYGFRLFDRGEEIDSCWGSLGSFDDAKEAIIAYLPEQAAVLVEGMDYFNAIAEEAGYDDEEAENGEEMGDDD